MIKVGDTFKISSGLASVVEYKTSSRIKVRLPSGHLVWTTSGQLQTGTVKDRFSPSVHGVGFLGEGKYNKSYKKAYNLWTNMLMRCYSTKYHNTHPSYRGCSVVTRWHNFQNFVEDIIQMDNWDTPGFELDKDLRVLGNKKYGPKYCSFIPQKLNTLMMNFSTVKGYESNSGRYCVRFRTVDGRKSFGSFDTIGEANHVYIIEKTKQIRSLAKLFKSNVIPEVFSTLKNYEV